MDWCPFYPTNNWVGLGSIIVGRFGWANEFGLTLSLLIYIYIYMFLFFCPKIVRSNILRVHPIYPHTEFFFPIFEARQVVKRSEQKQKFINIHRIKQLKKIQTKRWLQEHPQNQGKTKWFPVLKPLRIYKRVGRNLFHHLKIIIFKLNLIYVTLVPTLLLSASQLAFISNL